MIWLNFLHLYQPANADEKTIREATEKSYWRLVRALEEHPKIKFTFNIAGCLVARWFELGYFDLIKRIKCLVKKGQLEITGSAAYHPILPLISEEETIRQIKENEEILKKYFGVKPRGFFFPEMASDERTLKLVKKLGYEWAVLDELAINNLVGTRNDKNKVFIDQKSGLKIIFRSRQFSNGYVPDIILHNIKHITHNTIIISANDGELYGLRHEDPTGEFEKLLDEKNLETETISEFIALAEKPEKINLCASSWESTEAELKRGEPFALWHSKKNKIQMKLWNFADLAYEALEKNNKDKNYDWARWHLVRGLASCTFWWASGKDFKAIFGPVAWNPDEIERYMSELLRAIRSLQNKKTLPLKIKAEKLYAEIRFLIWQKHWQKRWKNTIQIYK
ncbi:MAG: polysaccharide deacetylase family protein [Patescibacteria group bacterium]|nr:polysaccharide deacetylase family protein [Patescibacteria group bacterium]MDD4610557.1 polysaccharide deacetylase family protein [Patescibacteria group bacterium]